MAVVLAALALAAFAVINAIQGALRDGRNRMVSGETGNSTMQRLSFVLLCALIFYVAIWGTA
ncbi:hypothetical protein [Oceaniglobus indicus]|uniref:hypothetical protein n=1 Tax=Oceaniglobus indicus TaxID=2047749 RepID=UPI000C1A4E02|nr:hypothetical protein [Oceaniglobus indicus]